MSKIKVLWIENDLKTREDFLNELNKENKDFDIEIITPEDYKKKKPDYRATFNFIFFDNLLDDGEFGAKLGLGAEYDNDSTIVFIYSEYGDDNLKKKSKHYFAGFLSYGRITFDGGFSLIHFLEDMEKLHSMSNWKDAMDLFQLPDYSKENLMHVVPSELKGLAGKYFAISFKNWCFDRIFQYTGILIDRKNLAAKLGLKEQSFSRKVEKVLEPFEFKGIFSESLTLFDEGSDKLWIEEKIDDFLFSDPSVLDSGVTKRMEAVQKIIKDINEDDLAKCYLCKKIGCEVLAEDNDGNDLPGHFNCTHPENAEKLVFFQSKRKFNEP